MTRLMRWLTLLGQAGGPAPPATVVTSGLLAEYKLDEESGTTAADSSGNGNDATLGIGGSFVPTWNARGLVFPSLTLLILPPALAAASVTRQWFCKSVPNNTAIQGLNSVQGESVDTYFNSGSAQVLAANLGAPAIQTLRAYTGNLSVAVVAGSPAKCYVNGVETPYLIQDNYTFPAASGTNFWLGYAFGAFRDEVWYALLYNRALSAAELLQNHAAVATTLTTRGVTLSGAVEVPRVAFCGDSRTLSASTATAARYPNVSMNGLSAHWVNLGVGGATTQIWVDTYAAKGVAALAGASGKVVALWLGTNDFATPGNLATVKTNLASLVATFQAAGATVAICTEIDRNVSFGGGQTQTTYRADVAALNVWINAGSSGADVVADIGANAHLQDADDTTYFTDKVHLTDAGAAIVAAAVATALGTLGVT